MSYSSPLKNLPDFLRQQNLEKMLEGLRQPASIGILASLGAHGLFFLFLPLLTSEPKQLDLQQTVQVVELTPEEQSRLPESASPLVLPQNPSPTIRTNPLQPSTPSGTTTSPPPLNDSSLYNFPLIPPPPLNIFPPIFQPPPLFGTNQIPLTIKQPPAPPPKPNQAPPPTTAVTPSPTASPGPVDASPAPGPSPSPVAPTRPDKIPPEAIARLRELQQAASDSYASTGETEDQGRANLNSWLGSVFSSLEEANPVLYKELEDSYKKQKPIEISAKYPAEACAKKLTSNAAVGLILGPDGQMMGQPVLLQRTGSKSLDKAALDAAGAMVSELKATGKPQLYFLRVPFEYKAENCPAEPPAATPPAS